MLRKAIIGIGAFTVGFVLGTAFGFGNGVEYQKDKQAKEQSEPGFGEPRDESGGGMVHIDLENQLE